MRPAPAQVGGLSGVPAAPGNEDSAGAGVSRRWLCRWAECSSLFPSPEALDAHLRAHGKGRGTRCLWRGCGKSFESRKSFRSHLSCHGEYRPFLCPHKDCGGAFKQRRNLKIHLQSHALVKPYFCPLEGCNKGFRHSPSLNLHLRTHSGERPFPCRYPDCTRSFSKRSSLVAHIRLHTGESPFACSWPRCERVFKQKTALQYHLMLHKGEKPCAYILSDHGAACVRQDVPCRPETVPAEKRQLECTHEGCAAEFDLKQSLAAHRKTHKAQKSLACPVSGCLSRFRQKNRLQKHLDMHSGRELQFPCLEEACREVFSSRKAVAAHSRVHKPARSALCRSPDVTATHVPGGGNLAAMQAGALPLLQPGAVSCTPGPSPVPGLAGLLSSWRGSSQAGQPAPGAACGALESRSSEAVFPGPGALYPPSREWWGSRLRGPASDAVLPESLPSAAVLADPGDLFQPQWHPSEQGAPVSAMMSVEPEPPSATAIAEVFWPSQAYQNRSDVWPPSATAMAAPGSGALPLATDLPDCGDLFPPRWSWQEEGPQRSHAGCVMPESLPAAGGFPGGEGGQPAAGVTVSCSSSSEAAIGIGAGWSQSEPHWWQVSRESAVGRLPGQPVAARVCPGDAFASASPASVWEWPAVPRTAPAVTSAVVPGFAETGGENPAPQPVVAGQQAGSLVAAQTLSADDPLFWW